MSFADFGGWQTLRTLSSQTAEGTSAPSLSAAFVQLALTPMPRVEIRVRSASLANSPTSVTLSVWRKSGGAVDKLGTFTIASSDIATPIPQMFELYDPLVYVQVESFVGGSSPTITATVEARAVFGG